MKKGTSGLDTVLKNLNQKIAEMKKGGRQGLLRAGLLVRRRGQIQTPEETGTLVNSWYGPELKTQSNGDIIAEIGLTASYAPFVHEMVGANFTGPRPGARVKARRIGGKATAKAKFLEGPLKESTQEILDLLAKETHIP